MPIEIKELHIRVAVNAPAGTGVVTTRSAAGEEARDAIVADCVEQVLQILQNKMER